MKIKLLGYEADDHQFELDLETHAYTIRKMVDASAATVTACGMGCEVINGLFDRKKEIFALYSHDETIFLYAAGESIPVSSQLSLSISGIFPFVRRITITQDGKAALSRTYWARDLLDDGLAHHDFFKYLQREISSPINLRSFKFFWDAARRGVDPYSDSFKSELEVHMKSSGIGH
ncbi:MAG: hypothetical protein Q8T11_01575 [Elusimicrobiota bacterium]|nr:hypothetical protein [Elusimicrobiota bacterium]